MTKLVEFPDFSVSISLLIDTYLIFTFNDFILSSDSILWILGGAFTLIIFLATIDTEKLVQNICSIGGVFLAISIFVNCASCYSSLASFLVEGILIVIIVIYLYFFLYPKLKAEGSSNKNKIILIIAVLLSASLPIFTISVLR